MPSPRYKPLVDALAADIRDGRLAPGSRLPTHRELAAAHGLALVTATRVYAELAAMGLVSGETGRGTFVRETALPPGHGVDQPAPAGYLVDLTFNYPALPGQAELLRGALRQLAGGGDLDALLRYQPHGGRVHERAAVARHLAARGLDVTGARVLIVNGAQHGLAVAAMALLKPGDVVAVDALTYPGFKVLAETLRLELAPLPAAGAGPDLDALERLCTKRRVRAVYAMPTLHNPLGWVMGASRRRRLVAIARRHGLLLIEDAAYAFLADDPPPPLAALAPECTLYVSGLSKSVATAWNTPALMTALACQWLDDGTVAQLEAGKRRDAMARQAIAERAFAGLRWSRHPASYFAWLPLVDDQRADRLATDLLREGIAVSTAEAFAVARPLPQAIRVALGSVDLAVLRQALTRVRRAIG